LCGSEHRIGTHDEVNPTGPWLRSNIYGRRINDKRDNRFNSDHMKSMHENLHTPIPKALQGMVDNMKLDSETDKEGGIATNVRRSANQFEDLTQNQNSALKTMDLLMVSTQEDKDPMTLNCELAII
jgi:hypothetical protein